MIIRHDRQGEQYRALAAKYSAPVSQTLQRDRTMWAEGTLIDPNWVLTAAHSARVLSVPTGIVLVAERNYPIAQIILHPAWSWDPDPDRWIASTDIALVELATPVMDIEPVPLYESKDELGQTVVFVGRGRFGTGLTGPAQADGQFRAATNKVEKTQNQWLVFRFDDPSTATDLEGISGPNDSGGPAFIETDGGLYVAGVSSHQDNRQQGQAGVYGVWEYYTRVSEFLEWVRQTI